MAGTSRTEGAVSGALVANDAPVVRVLGSGGGRTFHVEVDVGAAMARRDGPDEFRTGSATSTWGGADHYSHLAFTSEAAVTSRLCTVG